MTGSSSGPALLPPDPAVVRAVARGVLSRGLLLRGDLVEAPLPARIGRYAVLRPLAAGAGRRAVRAHDPVLGRDVRIEVADGLSPAQAERLQAELRALARLGHPNVAVVHDGGRLEDGTPYFVLEDLAQPSLRDRWPEREEGLDALVAAARAVHAAHEVGVQHLALDPTTILPGPRPVVVGWGTRAAESGAPEQQAGAQVGPWTDVHALGAVLFEVLTGIAPQDAGGRGAEELAPDAPRALAAVAARALHPSPVRRFASAADFARAVDGARRAARARPVASDPLRALSLAFTAAALAIAAVTLAYVVVVHRAVTPAPVAAPAPATPAAPPPPEPAQPHGQHEQPQPPPPGPPPHHRPPRHRPPHGQPPPPPPPPPPGGPHR